MYNSFANGMNLLNKINRLGYEAYIIGGAVRDTLLNKPINDIDIATNCPMVVLQKEFYTHEIGKSKDFGILTVECEGEFFEVAQFRSDGDYTDGRRPDNIRIVNNLREDVLRRDFTINALSMNTDGTIIDYVGGAEDIKHRILRAVGDPEDRFKEDHLRMIRAVRFASKDGFKIDRNTRLAIRRNFKLINKVSKERICGEIFKAAKQSGEEFASFILILDRLKLLYQIFPEITNLKYFKHDMAHHPEGPTVFDHSIKCVKILNGADSITKIAALLHDIGKGISFQEEKYGWKLTYHGHAAIGGELIKQICERLKMSQWATEALEFTTMNHMKFHDILDMKPSKIVRIAIHPRFDMLKQVAWADEFSRGETYASHKEFDKKLARIYEIRDTWKPRVVKGKIKVVDGNRVMELTGIEPGPEVGKIIREAEEIIIDTEIDPKDQDEIDSLILKVHNK